MTLFDALASSDGRRWVFDKMTIGIRNRLLDLAFILRRRHYLAKIQAAVEHGIDWFRPQEDVTMSVLIVLDWAHRHSNTANLNMIEDKIAHYRRTIRDPALRVFDRDYDPDAPEFANIPHVMKVRPYLPTELLMVDAANADKAQLDETFLAKLAEIADEGGYGTTHIVVGGTLLKRFSDIPHGPIDRLMLQCVPSLVKKNATSYAGDQFAERAMALQWLELDNLVRPSWILRLLRAQNDDGGWQATGVPPMGRSNQHTTCLAIAVLAQFCDQHS